MCRYTQQQSFKIYEVKTDKTERKNRKVHKYSGNVNIPIFLIDRTTRQMFSKDTEEQNTINLDLIDIYRIVQPSTAEYTFFSSVSEKSVKTDIRFVIKQICVHVCDKTNLNKFTPTSSLIQSMFSDHNRIKPEIGNGRRTEKSLSTGMLNNIFLNNSCIKEEISNIKRF